MTFTHNKTYKKFIDGSLLYLTGLKCNIDGTIKDCPGLVTCGIFRNNYTNFLDGFVINIYIIFYVLSRVSKTCGRVSNQ
jgi:hypothetical protein